MNPFYGRHHSEETKEKNRIAHIGKSVFKELRQKISKAMKGRVSPLRGRHHSEEYKQRMRIACSGWHQTDEVKQKLSRTKKKLWLNPEYAKKHLKSMYSTMNKKPTQPEKRLRTLLNKLFPGEYKYVGDGDVWIGGKNPDFININGQKKIIEMFGDYWHSKKHTGVSKKENRVRRQKHFARYGFHCCVIWQSSLSDMKSVKDKLREFHRMGGDK